MIFGCEMPHSDSAPGLASRLHVGERWYTAACPRRFTGPEAMPQPHFLCVWSDDLILLLALKAVTGLFRNSSFCKHIPCERSPGAHVQVGLSRGALDGCR